MTKASLSAQHAKAQFVQSIHNWLMKTLDDRGKAEFKDCFQIEGSSIMCHLPKCYFDMYDIPDDLTIEMKFIAKKS